MAKKLSQLMPDLKAALEDGMRDAATEVVLDLKRRSPYWSGDFEAAWVVKQGQTPAPSDIPSRDFSEVPERRPRPAQPSPILGGVPDPILRLGYAISNRMEYSSYAADLAPWSDNRDGTLRYEHPGADQGAEPNWFVKYVQGGEMQATVRQAFEKKKREAGF